MTSKRLAAIGLLFFFSANSLLSASDTWTPEVKFQLEDGTREETLLWVSGFSYAVNSIGRANIALDDGLFCAPDSGFIGSREVLNILNESFEGEAITSSKATWELMKKLPEIYPCN